MAAPPDASGTRPRPGGRPRARVALAAVLTLAGAVALAGCVDGGSLGDPLEELRSRAPGPLGGDADATLNVFVQGTNPGGYGAADAEVSTAVAAVAGDREPVRLEPAPEPVDLAAGDPSPIATGAADPVRVESVSFTLASVEGSHEGEDFARDALDLQVQVPLDLTLDRNATTTVVLGADLGAAGDPSDGFDPNFTLLAARQDGETIDAQANGSSGPDTRPPVARMEVFNGTGANVYESNFEARGGEALPVVEGRNVTFSASPSTAPGGSIASYEWDFGDGAGSEGANATGDEGGAEGRTVAHAFDDGGMHTVNLTVTDEHGAEDSIQVDVPVRYLPSEDGETLFAGNASGSFTAAARLVVDTEEHHFEIPDAIQRNASGSNGSAGEGHDENASAPDDPEDGVSVPAHGGGHGDAGDDTRRLAAATFRLSWNGTDDRYTFTVARDGETLAEESSTDGTITVDLAQLDGWYTDGGNYTTTVQYDQGAGGEYEVDVTGTYIPVPH